MKLVLTIVFAALAIGVLFPRMNARLWSLMSLIIIAVLAYVYFKS